MDGKEILKFMEGHQQHQTGVTPEVKFLKGRAEKRKPPLGFVRAARAGTFLLTSDLLTLLPLCDSRCLLSVFLGPDINQASRLLLSATTRLPVRNFDDIRMY